MPRDRLSRMSEPSLTERPQTTHLDVLVSSALHNTPRIELSLSLSYQCQCHRRVGPSPHITHTTQQPVGRSTFFFTKGLGHPRLRYRGSTLDSCMLNSQLNGPTGTRARALLPDVGAYRAAEPFRGRALPSSACGYRLETAAAALHFFRFRRCSSPPPHTTLLLPCGQGTHHRPRDNHQHQHHHHHRPTLKHF